MLSGLMPVAALLEELGHEARPSRLMARADARAVVAVEVLLAVDREHVGADPGVRGRAPGCHREHRGEDAAELLRAGLDAWAGPAVAGAKVSPPQAQPRRVEIWMVDVSGILDKSPTRCPDPDARTLSGDVFSGPARALLSPHPCSHDVH